MARLGQVFGKTLETQKIPEKWKVEYIHYSKLRRSKFQYCDPKTAEEIENLADLILANGGVEQNLLVRKYNADEYEIIAGHKRTLACERLVERGYKDYAFLPCIIKNESEAKTRLSVITSNAHHTKTQYEIMHEIQELKYLMEHYPDEFPDIEMRGRIIERIAKQLGISRSTATDYVMIGNGLSEEGMKSFERGEIKKDAALVLSTLPEKEQNQLIERGVTKGRELREYKKNREEVVPNFGTTEENLPGQYKIADTQMTITEEEKPITAENEAEDSVRKRLFGLKNMEQREAFIGTYQTWKVWTRNLLTEETFYRFDLPDDSAIVVKEYPCFDSLDNKERVKQEYYLLHKGYRYFNSCKSNMSMLKEHLEDVAKELIKK